jgi:hypothetical protein
MRAKKFGPRKVQFDAAEPWPVPPACTSAEPPPLGGIRLLLDLWGQGVVRPAVVPGRVPVWPGFVLPLLGTGSRRPVPYWLSPGRFEEL